MMPSKNVLRKKLLIECKESVLQILSAEISQTDEKFEYQSVYQTIQ